MSSCSIGHTGLPHKTARPGPPPRLKGPVPGELSLENTQGYIRSSTNKTAEDWDVVPIPEPKFPFHHFASVWPPVREILSFSLSHCFPLSETKTQGCWLGYRNHFSEQRNKHLISVTYYYLIWLPWSTAVAAPVSLGICGAFFPNAQCQKVLHLGVRGKVFFSTYLFLKEGRQPSG